MVYWILVNRAKYASLQKRVEFKYGIKINKTGFKLVRLKTLRQWMLVQPLKNHLIVPT